MRHEIELMHLAAMDDGSNNVLRGCEVSLRADTRSVLDLTLIWVDGRRLILCWVK